MSTHFNDIEAALDIRLGTLAGSPTIERFNLPFTSDATENYLRPTFLPAETVQACFGDLGQDLTNGIYQVDVFHLRGKGRSSQPDVIADHFKRGTILTYNGVNIRVISASIEPSFTEDNFMITPVSIRWQVFTSPRA